MPMPRAFSNLGLLMTFSVWSILSAAGSCISAVPRTLRRGLARLPSYLPLGLAGAGVFLAGCTTPLQRRSEDELRRSLMESVEREVREARRFSQTLESTRVDRVPELRLKPEILAKLERDSGPNSYPPAIQGTGTGGFVIGPSLLGGDQRAVAISLQRAISSAVANNLNVQFARLGPAIEEARAQAAEAAFDWTFFSTVQWISQDQENITSSGFPSNARTFDERQVIQSQAGLRQRLITGGVFTVQQNIDYTDNATNGTFFNPDPASDASLLFQLDQPLLRNFGSDVALAEVQLATNSQRDRVLQLRAELLRTVTDTEQAYWGLVLAAGNLQIFRKLLDKGVDVRDVIRARLNVDANPAQYANAVSAVENRRASIIRAENQLQSASDQLKLLMNDSELTIGSDTLILPVDRPVDAPTAYNFADMLLTAVRERPEIQRALLGIDDSSIRLRVAESGRLPQFDLRAQVRFNALASSVETSLSRQAEANLVDYLIGASFEVPLGNRGAEAGVRLRSLERLQSVITYRDVIRQVTGTVKGSLRDVLDSYRLIAQQRAARLAGAEQLRSIEARERTVQALTPEFLDFKLRTQDDLAAREREELAALTQYNTSLAILSRETGTALQRNRIRFEVPRNILEQQPGLR